MNYAVVGNSLIACRGDDPVLTIPDAVTTIDASAFENVKDTAECIILPDGFHHVSEYMFASCSCLREVVFSNNLVSIGSRAFYGCSMLESAILPDGIESIGSEAFRFCRNLQHVLIPGSVLDIGEDAFASYCKTHLEISMSTFLRFNKAIFAFDDFNSLKITNGGKSVLLLYFPCSEENPLIEKSYKSCLSVQGDTLTVDYELYDSFFSRIRYSEFKCNIALYRLIFPEKLSAEMKLIYKTYLRLNRKKVAALLKKSGSLFSDEELHSAGIYFDASNKNNGSSADI